jgi:hypothetical protein
MTITKDLNIESAEITGNNENGRVTIVTNDHTDIRTLARIAVEVGDNYPSDNVNVFFQQRAGVPALQLMPAGEDSTGWEIFTLDLMQPNTTYVFDYHAKTF